MPESKLDQAKRLVAAQFRGADSNLEDIIYTAGKVEGLYEASDNPEEKHGISLELESLAMLYDVTASKRGGPRTLKRG